jgi:hypothetical protein
MFSLNSVLNFPQFLSFIVELNSGFILYNILKLPDRNNICTVTPLILRALPVPYNIKDP